MTAWACRSDNKISLEASEVSRLQDITGCRVLTEIAKFQRTEEDSLYAIMPSKCSRKYYSFEVANFPASELESTIKGILASYLILVRRED